MTINQVIEMLSNLPTDLKERELTIVNTQAGEEFSINTDISQLSVRWDRVQVYVEPRGEN